ncbi:glycoside hydrolase family 15 protein [Paenibacillus thermoaerophilus]|uniref:Glycoside hydrolase family 15 protein n=1 Tax=Paenibacillus thermoaerophilus TaxID=1215385 RepID=A0ABW2V732_9BACL|nr:glycoside hydrolase family 15 protein [Paenibacillus thermoaerophilus]TMV15940.1 glycoside hydrolase family 15 protein [Paenibacillus thermoaerophilus]
MPRPLVAGNGKMLVNLDRHMFIRDVYYPYVGQMNHVGGYACRFGVWADGRFEWLDHPDWSISLRYAEDSLVTESVARNEELGLELLIQDAVHQRDDIFLRRITVRNLRDESREIRLFFHQDLSINETEVGDTAVYYPFNHTVCHYKKDFYFMFNVLGQERGMYQYTTGIKRFHSAEGTWRDAEDGHLMGNPIAQGSVDSTISLRLFADRRQDVTGYYWMTAGRGLEEVKKLDAYVRDSHPGKLIDRVKVYWSRWVNKSERDYADLNADIVRLYKQSLLIVRTQTDTRGAIVAANDSDIMQFNRDHYCYMWPRDGALVAYAMSAAGYQGMVVPFFEFCQRALTPEGYLHHKYNPDGTVGSSWHPYFKDGRVQLPIQEDETALVLFALWQDYKRHGVLEIPQGLYRNLIRRSAKFLHHYWVPELNLPQPSYDLWEERYGIYTFTASAVFGGLEAAANFCKLFGDDERSLRYRNAADRLRRGILEHLWNEDAGRFARGLYYENGRWQQDMTLESSVYGLFEFGVLPATDDRVVSTMTAIRNGLSVKTPVGGVARYYNDYYFQRSGDLEQVPGNPWIICTLWMAEWEIERAASPEELESPRRTLEWVTRQASESGVLPEQLDPFSGEPLSVAPLTWSHATFVLAVEKYMDKYRKLHGRI